MNMIQLLSIFAVQSFSIFSVVKVMNMKFLKDKLNKPTLINIISKHIFTFIVCDLVKTVSRNFFLIFIFYDVVNIFL